MSIIIALFFLIPFVASSQEWSEPSTIFSGSINRDADAVVDSNGHLHVVWAHMVSDNYWKILYSKSVDKGQTWTEPFDVVWNTSLWMSSPRIALGKNNMLYVTYDYNTVNPANMYVHMKTFNGTSWSPSKVVSEGFPGSDFSKMAVDTAGVLYIFWINTGVDAGTFLYRTFYEDDFSEIIKPYGGTIRYSLRKPIFDKNNRLHCQGWVKYSNNYYGNLAYFSMNNGTWSDYTVISDSVLAHSDMDIDSLNNPHMVWWKVTSSVAPSDDGTFYSFLENSEWSIPEYLSDNSEFQVIVIDALGNKHIVDKEKTENGYRHVHFQHKNGIWNGNDMEENSTGFSNYSLIQQDSQICLFYSVRDTGVNNKALNVRTYNIGSIVSVQNDFQNDFSLVTYPNPFSNEITISIETKLSNACDLNIYNFHGSKVFSVQLVSNQKGFCSFVWDGIDFNGSRLPSGVYLVQIIVGTSVTTRSVILMSDY
ncbi:MAG: T9SS type A sorting domain-containing protein [Salinivirgaceae bacterium]|nr:T9SS type A sorting domain-containing protein [Salinivirgaceae bacterium]